jgi:hypothetical protein
MRLSHEAWLPLLRFYAAISFAVHLAWELLQLPLYTIWWNGSPRELAWAVLHCTTGDVLIALAALVFALLLVGEPRWPEAGLIGTGLIAIVFGVGYTTYSEWLNTSLRATWAYTVAMPVLPPLGTGVAPLAQWVIVPPFALWLARRRASRLS